MTKPLDGIRVVEVAGYVFVPSAAALLGDWGADVIKIEHPERGDPIRGWVRTGVAADKAARVLMLEQPNRNKRSMGLNIATDEGRDILYQLIERTDVFITNMLPHLRQRLKIDVEHLRAHNPKLVYVRGSAHGPRGPMADVGGFDSTAYWFGGGFASVLTVAEADSPVPQRGGIGDAPSGAFLAGGVAAALFQRERTGVPPVVDVSLLSSAVWTLNSDILASGLVEEGESALPWTRRNPPNPMSNTYRTSDGRWLAISMYQHDFWPQLCRMLGRPELADDPRFADGTLRFQNTEACVAALDEAFGAYTLEELTRRLNELGASWGPMRTPREVHDYVQVEANGYLPRSVGNDDYEFQVAAGPVQFDETTTEIRRPAPELGQHTEEILLELGLSWDDIAAHKAAGAVI